MDATTAAQLRAPFPAEAVGKRPQPTCKACSDAPQRVCGKHSKQRCQDCGQYMTTAHVHLDYVGHADVTARFLDVDPDWSWEPFAIGADGLPQLDASGGLWMRVTVAGTTRIGYGDAQGKKGPNAVKEAIGDGFRNAGMRFGVGLEMWMKGDREAAKHATEDEPAATRAPTQPDVPKSEADQIRDSIREFVLARPGWNLATVAQEYTREYPGRTLKTEADPDPMNAFFSNLQVEAAREDATKGGEAA